MKIEDFYELKNFHIGEKDIYDRRIDAKIEIIEEELMLKIDRAVSLAKETFGYEEGRFIVHCIVLGEHASKSKHYIGQAIDGHFAGLNLYQSVMVGFKAGFTGIGYYVWWRHPGVHFDIRPQMYSSTWASFGEGHYSYDFQAFVDRLLQEADK